MNNKHSLNKLIINLSNIASNFNKIKNFVKKNTKVAAVVKANCYGLGIDNIVQTLAENGCEEFYVAYLDEGIALRKLLVRSKIYVLSGISHSTEFKQFSENNLTPVLNNKSQLKSWQNIAVNLQKSLPACIHVDTGMTRLGISYDDINELMADLNMIEIEYIISHLACADMHDHFKNSVQLEKFKALQKKYPQFKYSFANSAGVMLGQGYHFDQVRSGAFLYGISIDNDNILKPEPIFELKSQILQIYKIENEESIGYCSSYKIKSGMYTATIPIGYADGYFWRLSNKGYVYINGIKVFIIGRVSMDYMTIDITHLPDNLKKIGTEVSIIGQKITIEALALLAETIPYEILTSLSKRFNKIYLN